MKCPHCGSEISPASMLGQSKKTMTPAAIEQRSKAGQISADKRRKVPNAIRQEAEERR